MPTYSWTVDVFTHELGHLMGSRHTHACVWNGNNTAIDGCWTPEGSCPTGPIPANGGTIMSYCHRISVGKNFSLGFGPQPSSLIRNRITSAPCVAGGGGGGGTELITNGGFESLSAYAGQTVRIQFRATNNASLPTSFRVDDVSVK